MRLLWVWSVTRGAGPGWGGCDDPSGARVERGGGTQAGADDALTETGGGAGSPGAVRPGPPPPPPAEDRGPFTAAALARPADLGLPFASWTLDRLVAYLGEKGIGMKRSRGSEVLQAEGLKWRQEETWFGARVDPEFERKRGRSSASTPPRPRAA